MPSTAGFFKGGREIWRSRGSSALSSLRGILGGRKYNNTTGSGSNTWREVDSHSQVVGKSHYVDVHGEQSSTYELTPGNSGQEIHVQREFQVV